ncbi:MAG: ATP-binding cassette domain-containing protein [Telmatospirillum sp.]|nr:ATP-binding cassette domain-containing protein [Telmatospirillum sp.]
MLLDAERDAATPHAPARPAPALSSGVLEVAGLAKRFGADKPVFSDVSFAVGKGEAVALLGANGAGKSTLLRCCLRLIEPDAGSIKLFGRELVGASAAPLRELRARVGFVFQRHNLVPRLSALSNTIHGALGRSASAGLWSPRLWSQALAPDGLRAEALACLARVGLADIAARRADRLSGGQSQRVAVARALMQQAEIVFADEPAASLDPAAGAEVMALFADLNRREKLTFVYTTHNLAHALEFSDRVIALRAGRIEIDAPTQSLRADDLRGLYG